MTEPFRNTFKNITFDVLFKHHRCAIIIYDAKYTLALNEL